MLLALLIVVGAGFGVLAQADQAAADRVPRGVVIGGVNVGNLKSADALARLEAQIGAPARRSVRVRVSGTTYRLSAKRAGVSVDLRSLVQRAADSGREGNFVTRGWRELTKQAVYERESVRIAVDREAVQKFVAGIADKVAVDAVDAQLTMSVGGVSVSESKPGKRLAGRDGLVERIERAFIRSGASRRLTARTVWCRRSRRRRTCGPRTRRS